MPWISNALVLGPIRSWPVSWGELLLVMVSVHRRRRKVEELTETSRSWYKRSEFGIRAAVFFSAATVSSHQCLSEIRAKPQFLGQRYVTRLNVEEHLLTSPIQAHSGVSWLYAFSLFSSLTNWLGREGPG